MRQFILVFLLLFINSMSALAQCAMCRATLENNFSNGDVGIAAGINFGIMYLFFAPYVAVATIAYFWYKTSKANARKELESGTLAR